MAFPFHNGVVDVDMSGRYLWEMFDNVASRVTKERKVSFALFAIDFRTRRVADLVPLDSRFM